MRDLFENTFKFQGRAI